jgi:hypothetical protein
MTDELKRLREALGSTRPEPDPEARRQAMDAALQAFDEEKARENAGATQGSAAGERQNGGRASLLARLFGGRLMNFTFPSLKPALMGGASLAVIAIAVLAARDLTNKDAIAPLPAPAELRSEVDRVSAVESNEVLRAAPAANAPERELLASPAPADLSAVGAANTVTLGDYAKPDDKGTRVRRAGEAPALVTIGRTAQEVQSVPVPPRADFALKQAKQFRAATISRSWNRTRSR